MQGHRGHALRRDPEFRTGACQGIAEVRVGPGRPCSSRRKHGRFPAQDRDTVEEISESACAMVERAVGRLAQAWVNAPGVQRETRGDVLEKASARATQLPNDANASRGAFKVQAELGHGRKTLCRTLAEGSCEDPLDRLAAD